LLAHDLFVLSNHVIGDVKYVANPLMIQRFFPTQ